MFRGGPPQGKLMPLTEMYQKSLLAPKQMEVELNSVKVPAIPPHVKLEGEVESLRSNLCSAEIVDFFEKPTYMFLFQATPVPSSACSWRPAPAGGDS